MPAYFYVQTRFWYSLQPKLGLTVGAALNHHLNPSFFGDGSTNFNLLLLAAAVSSLASFAGNASYLAVAAADAAAAAASRAATLAFIGHLHLLFPGTVAGGRGDPVAAARGGGGLIVVAGGGGKW